MHKCILFRKLCQAILYDSIVIAKKVGFVSPSETCKSTPRFYFDFRQRTEYLLEGP